MKNLAFWMELNTLMKILAFYILSFQNSWYFAFYGGIKHNLSSLFHPKFFGFWPIILQNGTKHHAKFLTKSIHSSFWILASRGQKKPKSSYPPYEKSDILDGTKLIYKNFDILYFIIPK
jgi:hypothetical protein